jgi:TonB-linked SusC/RagA family outer membrane protein
MIIYTYSSPHCVKWRRLIKKILIMKLIVFLLFIACMQVNAAGYAQKITISQKNTTLEKAFEEIKRQSGYKFWYEGVVIKKANRLDIDFHNVTITEALDYCFKNQPFSYKVFGTSVVVKEKKLVQKRIIQGTVTDSLGVLPGVSVKVKGKSGIGGTTDSSGKYVIDIPGDDDVLVFSMIGYITQEIPAKGLATINVMLKSSSQGLEQVVVVGYGTQKKTTVTGAIASISTKEIKQSPAANLAVTLAGRLPGLTAIQRSGEPGRDVTQLFIRGQGTVNSQSPIILVDGVERELTYVDPNEVESVTILKDASSTAIFGVRGANGVILITTRRGTSLIPEINFSAESGIQDFQRFPTLINSYDYATTRNLAQMNDGQGPAYSDEALEHFRTGDDPLNYANTDWKKHILKDYSTQQRYNLNVSGAGEAVKYFVNAGFLKQDGMFKTEENLSYDPSFKLNRYNFRSNIDIKINKSLKAIMNLGGYLEKQNMPAGIYTDLSSISSVSPALHILAQLITDQLPTIPGPLTPDGEISTWEGGFYPPYGQLNRSGYIQQTRNNIMATFGMEQQLDFVVKGLSAKLLMSFDAKTTNNLLASRQYLKLVQVVEPDGEGGSNIFYKNMGDSKNTPLTLSGSRIFSTLSNVQGYLNYRGNFNKHAVSGLLLYQQQQNIIDSELPYNLRGLAGRFTYGYDNRYFLELNAGYNGSEQFAKGRRFGFFPAVSGAWVISNEPFFNKNDVMNTLKLRGSYGKVGNDRIGSRRFLYLDDVQVNGGGYSPSLGLGQYVMTRLLKNNELQWEVSKKVNLGLEATFFKSIDLVLDVFSERRDNILRTRGTVPVVNGLPIGVLPPVNIGVIENKGFEVELNYKKSFNRDFNLFTKVNLNYATNRQIEADEPILNDTYAYRYRQTDYRIGQNFGYIVDRYFENIEDINNSPVQNVGGHASRPGDFKYIDVNKDGVVDEKDISPYGFSNIPEYQFGLAFNLNYKNWDLSVLLQGVTNVSNYYNSWGTFAVAYYRERHTHSWTEERVMNGEEILYPRLTTETNPNEIPNSFFILDASYIRVKNLEIGYVLPSAISKKIGSSRIRLYGNGLNLFTWDKLPTKDFDPELSSNLTYPIVRVFNFGVNFSF